MTNKEQITISSGNVFQDLGLADADELLIKAKLVHKISSIIEERQLTQSQAAEILGIDQPKISALLRGRLSGFSIERLIKYLNAFNTKVDLTFSTLSLQEDDKPKMKRVAHARVATSTVSKGKTSRKDSPTKKQNKVLPAT